MKSCNVYHTGIYEHEKGVLHDNKVYILDKEGNQHLPKDMYLAVIECEEGLAQIEVDGKWGFANIYTGEIVIEPKWDYAGPFYHGYAHVALGADVYIKGIDVLVQNGKHGYIDKSGNIIVPIEYSDASDIPIKKVFFQVSKEGKWGLIDCHNNVVIDLIWDRLDKYKELFICGKKVTFGFYIGYIIC